MWNIMLHIPTVQALIDMLSNRNIYTHECMLLTICNGYVNHMHVHVQY